MRQFFILLGLSSVRLISNAIQQLSLAALISSGVSKLDGVFGQCLEKQSKLRIASADEKKERHPVKSILPAHLKGLGVRGRYSY